MLLRLRVWTERLRGSLFYVPAAFVTAAIALAVTVSWLESRHPQVLLDAPVLLSATVASARAILTTIAAAIITVAGIVFSVTVVSVQLAASQFSPRVLRSFLRDRVGQTVIGIVVGTFTHCLVVLTTVRVGDDAASEPFVAGLSVTLGVGLAILAVLAIVAFIDYSARSMQVGQIVRRITKETRGRIEDLLPEEAGPDPPREEDDTALPDGPSLTVRSVTDGFVQQLDEGLLVRDVPEESTIRLDVRVGAFVIEGTPLATVWPVPEDPTATGEGIRNSLAIGSDRTLQQDLAFGLRQLVDIGLRALSPGINDPTTAYEVLANLGAVLGDLLQRELPARTRELEGRRIHRPHEPDAGDYVDGAFDQLRLAGASQPAVAIAILQTLGQLDQLLRERGLVDRTRPLRRQAGLVVRTVDQLCPTSEDRARVRRVAARLSLLEEQPAD